MTNADKYGMDEDEVNELKDKFEEWHKNNTDVRGYGEALFRFLQAEVKPTLTEDEKVILKCINKINFQVIGRAKDNELYLYDEDNDDRDYTFNDIYTTLFQFIQPRRRI